MTKYERYFTGRNNLDPELTPAGWGWSVPPERSDLGTNEMLTFIVKGVYPELIFEQATRVDGNLVIFDLLPKANPEKRSRLIEQTKQLNYCSKATIQVLDGAILTERMLKLIESNLILDANCLVIYILEAGKDVFEFISTTQIDSVFTKNALFAPVQQRLVGKGNSQNYIDTSCINIDWTPTEILVVDDVICSGSTLKMAATAIRQKFNYNIPLYFASWLYLYTGREENKYDDSGVNGFNKGITPLVISGNSGIKRPPINSLSCLVNPERKSPQIIKSYANKYFDNPGFLLEITQNLKELL